MSGLFTAMEVSSSGMTAQRRRMNLLITNIANARTTRTPEGGPYQRKDLVFESDPKQPFWAILAEVGGNNDLDGVRVAEVVKDPSPPMVEYEPNHPDADENGFVAYPNVKPLEEMANLMSSVRSFEMNIRAFEAIRQIIEKSIEMGRG